MVLLTICLSRIAKNLMTTKGCVWGMIMRMIKPINSIQEAKSKDGSATDELFLLHHKNLKETKDDI